ncbi:MAG: CHASE domain-containing protein, partial [Pseudomonadota bacterium]|nr:CHASE domain-containing protein [Pseudomonadota bacterium]
MQRIPKHSEISLIFVIIIGLGLSLVAFFYVKQWEHNQIIEDKKQQADVHVRSLRQTFTAFANILYSISGLHHAYDRITRENFTRFVKHDLLAQPGIQALEWVPFVPASERQKVERKARSEGIKDFYFWEYTSTGKKQRAAAREAHYPVLFTEPMAIHENRLGYDLGANEMLKRALEQARDQGQLTASGAVRIHSGHTETLGFRIFVPVYRSESKPVTVEQRRQKLVGFAAGVLLFNNMVQIVLRLPQQKTKDVFLMIVDETPSAK